MKRGKRMSPISEKGRDARARAAEQVSREGKAFHDAIRGLRCVVCGRTAAEAREDGTRHQAHHAIRKEVLKRLGLTMHLWSPNLAVCVCEEPCHGQHTRRSKRILRAVLPGHVLQHVRLLGLEDELLKEYPL
jgi:hypothetical protein